MKIEEFGILLEIYYLDMALSLKSLSATLSGRPTTTTIIRKTKSLNNSKI
jgi:hypothetical protein